MKFSEKIIQARKAKALTQEDLAEAVGVSRQAVSKWETEEAKPDLDKLVAICKVLELSMDYLCLDKQPEVTVEALPVQPVKGRKRSLIAAVCVGLVAVIAVCLLTIGLGKKPDGPNKSEPVQNQTMATAPNYAELLSQLKVADGRLETPYTKEWRITFVPSIQVPGMEVQIAVRNNITGSTYFYDTTKSGAGYYLDYKRSDHAYHYDFIAVCNIGEVTVQFPLINVEGSGGLYSYDYVWMKR